jgi:hypothetical protein
MSADDGVTENTKPGWGNETGGAAEPVLRVCHIYSDDDGVSHFRETALPFRPAPIAGLEDPPLALGIDSGPGAAFLRLAPRQMEEWHPAPRRVFLIPIQGASRVTVGDGMVKEFRPGDVVLMDDTTGQGHITEAIGDIEHIALIVPVGTVGA